jgi:hypothetical protein
MRSDTPRIYDELERLRGQVGGLQKELRALLAQRFGPAAEHAGDRVAAIVDAAEQSAADLTAEAQKEAAAWRERQREEAQIEADRIRAEAQAEAATIRADAARVRDQMIERVRTELERTCEQLAAQLQTSVREAINAVVAAGGVSGSAESAAEAEAHHAAPDRGAPAGEDLESATTVLEQSLHHLSEIAQSLPESR